MSDRINLQVPVELIASHLEYQVDEALDGLGIERFSISSEEMVAAVVLALADWGLLDGSHLAIAKHYARSVAGSESATGPGRA